MNDPFEKSSLNQFLAIVPILPPVFWCFQFFFVQKQPSICVLQKFFLKHFGKFTEKIEQWWLFLGEIDGGLQLYWKRSPLQTFYCKFYEIFHRRFFTECLRTAASIICILLKYHAIILAGVFQADCNLCVEWHPTRGVQFLVFRGFLVVLAGFWFWWRDWALGYNSMCFEIFLIFSNLLSS